MRGVDEIQKQLERWITHLYDVDDSDHPYYIASDFTAFDDIFPSSMSCYEVSDVIRTAGIVTKGILEDHEHSCCYYNFKTRISAERFCKRLAKFIATLYERELNKWK